MDKSMRNNIIPHKNIPPNRVRQSTDKSLLNKFNILILFLLMFFYIMSAVGSDKHRSEISENDSDYFKELTLGDYTVDNKNGIVKWVDDINIFIEGDMPVSLQRELDSLILEINLIISDVELKLVTTEAEANYYIFVNLAEKYRSLYPDSTVGSLKTGGVFNTYGNLDYEITHGSIYIDLVTAESNIGKFALRKLLTQSLGIHYQSRRYENSVFAVNRRSIRGYSDLDQAIIRTLYSECVKAGMDKFELDNALLNGC